MKLTNRNIHACMLIYITANTTLLKKSVARKFGFGYFDPLRSNSYTLSCLAYPLNNAFTNKIP